MNQKPAPPGRGINGNLMFYPQLIIKQRKIPLPGGEIKTEPVEVIDRGGYISFKK